ncbi:hypothetical protein F5144DRAFT_460284, partial [Chaetomium tenue]
TRLRDLTVLVRTNTTFYSLATPHIYAHFDIAWPENLAATSGHNGIRNLISGLSTVCIESTFARELGENDHQNTPRSVQLSTRNHGQYTKTFGIGNSPLIQVAEYIVYKTGGIILGTLVANAIGRMNNLETFSWDMPTGVHPRVFEALGSLAHQPGRTCKLSHVRVRWHDSSSHMKNISWATFANIHSMALVPEGTRATPIGLMLPPGQNHPPPRAPVPYS